MALILLLSAECYQCYSDEHTTSLTATPLATEIDEFLTEDQTLSQIKTTDIIDFNQPLYDAILKNDLTALIYAVEAGAEINISKEMTILSASNKYAHWYSGSKCSA